MNNCLVGWTFHNDLGEERGSFLNPQYSVILYGDYNYVLYLELVHREGYFVSSGRLIGINIKGIESRHHPTQQVISSCKTGHEFVAVEVCRKVGDL